MYKPTLSVILMPLTAPGVHTSVLVLPLTPKMRYKTEFLWALAAVLLVAQDAVGQATVTSTRAIALPTARPSNAFEVPANFPSVGFETAFLPGYNNSFSDKLVASLASRMAAPPIIRIGGTSG